jgi:hypothetical protein
LIFYPETENRNPSLTNGIFFLTGVALFAGLPEFDFLLVLNFIEYFFNLLMAQALLSHLADSNCQEEECKQSASRPRF